VTALDKATNRSQHITITASSGLSESEIQKMKTEAEAHAEEDRKRKELVEAKNLADNTIYTAEKLLKDAGDKISADLKKEVEDKVAAVRSALSSENSETLQKSVQELNDSLQKVGTAMYSQQQGGPSAGPDAGQSENPGSNQAPGSDDGDVVDGEFKPA